MFKEFTFSDKLKQLAVELEFHRDPRVLQSMVICKNARVGGEVTSHDDSTFLFTDPPSAIGFWFALEDSTTENGCLSFVPGSHKLNKVDKRLVRVPGGGGTELVKVEGVEPCGIDWDDKRPGVEWRTAECRAGDLVLIHGTVVHRSERNLSDKSRFIYTFHCVESSREGVEWDEKNWSVSVQEEERVFHLSSSSPLPPSFLTSELKISPFSSCFRFFLMGPRPFVFPFPEKKTNRLQTPGKEFPSLLRTDPNEPVEEE